MFLNTKQDEALFLYFLLKRLQFHHFTLYTSRYFTTSSTSIQQKEDRAVSEYLQNLKIIFQISCSDYSVSLYLPSNFFAIIYFLATKNWTFYNPTSFWSLCINLLTHNQTARVVYTGCRENYPTFREHTRCRSSSGVLNTPPPLPAPRHEGRYASLHEIKLRDNPEVYKLSEVTTLKFDSKILSNENSII